VTLNTRHLGVIYRACVSIHCEQSAYQFEMSTFTLSRNMMSLNI